MIQKQAEIRSPYRGMAELFFPEVLYRICFSPALTRRKRGRQFDCIGGPFEFGFG
jgi:hypothetical protein